ncbi:ABC transporter permease [Microbacterium sp.]|uniref:ABC transporter permease n=1 Tax=Microbacterium sp. TaxID=51671 RepID=UPI003C714EFA
MIAFIIRRTLVGIVMVIVMIFVVFALFFANGNPAINQCGKYCTPEKLEQTTQLLGYDKSIPQQFGAFVSGLVVGRDFPVDDEYREQLIENGYENRIVHCAAPCLGYSQSEQKTVNALLVKAAGPTISLSIASFVLWIVFGVLIGILAAVYKGRWLDRIVVGATLVVYALPVFVIGTFLLQYVSVKWGLWPYPRFEPLKSFADLGPWIIGITLPALTLALFFMAAYVRYTRAFVLESMSEDYIRTARAKGLSERTVLFKHGLRAALTPLVTLAGLDFAGLLAGAIITESVFNYQGMGALAVKANNNHDLPVLIGLVIVGAVAVIVMNIIVDILYAYIDPRVRVTN